MQVRDDMLLVVGGHCWIGGARSATLGSRSGLLHGRSRGESTTRSTQRRPRRRVKPHTVYQHGDSERTGSNMTIA
jgi:hypothetical protein